MTADRPEIAVGEPIDPADVEPVCPQRFAGLCVPIATPYVATVEHGERIQLVWPGDTPDACLISREAAESMTAAQNASGEALREADRHAMVLRRLVEELTAERDLLASKLAQPCGECHPCLNRAERDRLRGLLAEAIDGWGDAHTAAVGYSHLGTPDRIAEIRREAGL